MSEIRFICLKISKLFVFYPILNLFFLIRFFCVLCLKFALEFRKVRVMNKNLLIFISSIVCLFFLTLEWIHAKTMNIREIELLMEAESQAPCIGVQCDSGYSCWID